VGVPTEWRTLIRRAAMAREAMTSRLPPGPGGPPAGGAPPADKGPMGQLSSHRECQLLYVQAWDPFLYRVVDTYFCTHRGGGIHWPTGDVHVFFVNTYDTRLQKYQVS
jgi:hypothetical protein